MFNGINNNLGNLSSSTRYMICYYYRFCPLLDRAGYKCVEQTQQGSSAIDLSIELLFIIG